MQLEARGSVHSAITLLEKTPKILETLLSEVAEETYIWKPAPERWSISEVLAHLVETEGVYSRRAERFLGEESPALESWDPAKSPAADGRRGDDYLVGFAEARSGSVALLSMMPPTAGERSAQHPDLGSVTFTEFLHNWASHDMGHIRQIVELCRAREFHPFAGPFQKYVNLKP
jgi:hypothetical protein